jgi:hypothetical protein
MQGAKSIPYPQGTLEESKKSRDKQKKEERMLRRSQFTTFLKKMLGGEKSGILECPREEVEE